MKLEFRGTPHNALLQVPESLLHYALSGLKNEPCRPPVAVPEEWDELFDVLADQYVLPLLHRNTRDWPNDCRPPEGFARKARESYFRNAARTHDLNTQIKTILNAFRQKGVRAVVLKGPALALSVYPDPVCRPSADIDLLVHPDRMKAAGKVMEDLGYLCICERFETMKDFFNDNIYAHRTDTIMANVVEVHWDLHRFSSLRTEGMIDDLFDRAVEVGAGAFKFEILSPADALIQRAVNNAFDKARSMRLIWIVDVVKLADTLKPPEWEHLARTSPSYNARSAVEFSLKAAQEWFELRLPEGFDDFNDWPPPSSFESRSWIKAARSYDGLIPLLQLCNSPSSSVIEKLRAYFHLAFPQKRSMRKDYAAGNTTELLKAHVERWGKWLTRFKP